LQPPLERKGAATVPNPQDSRRRAAQARVLLADDHPLFADMLQLLLEADDRVEVLARAADGVEAVELALRFRPDVVLMDVQMPRLDGIGALKALRPLLPGVRVVMLTSSAAVDDVERARDAGAFAYLTKDADAATIRAEVVRAAESAHPPLTERWAA
jgi:DNA-binding NarL/FixJ family response regulator